MKRVVITGASSGIGFELATRYRERGVPLTLIGRNVERLRSAAPDADHVAIDFLDDASLENAARALRERIDHVDALIHSAGVVTLGPIAEAPLADLDLNYRVNLRAPVALTQALLPSVVRAKGQVVFINSGAGLNANATWGHYAASKHGLKAVADALRHEVKPQGVRVMSVYPGRTATPMQQRVRSLEGQPYDANAFIQVADVSQMIMTALELPRSASVIDLNIRPGA